MKIPGKQLDVVSDKSYVHEQLIPSSVWTVNHNLGRKPSVVIEDSAHTTVQGTIHHDDENTLTITFSAPFGGVAQCN